MVSDYLVSLAPITTANSTSMLSFLILESLVNISKIGQSIQSFSTDLSLEHKTHFCLTASVIIFNISSSEPTGGSFAKREVLKLCLFLLIIFIWPNNSYTDTRFRFIKYLPHDNSDIRYYILVTIFLQP